jgi:antitoxin component YwqK of YwqJK toxin-antitoxin module
MRIHLAILIILTNSSLILGQDFNYNRSYFDSLIAIVSTNSMVKEYKLFEKRYLSNKIKYQELRVKYKNDSEDRFWQIGKAFSYFKNGKIKGWNNVDPIHKVLIDTAYNYHKNGLINYMIIWLNDTNFTQIPLYAPFSKVWLSYPIRYRKKEFRNGRLLSEGIYNFNNEMFELDGEMIYYKSDGNIDSEYVYKNGKRIK